MNALMYSGSIVSTVSQSFFESLQDKTSLKSIKDLGLKTSIAGGSALEYLVYIECNIIVQFLTDFSIDVPVLVVPDTYFNSNCPVII